MEYKVQFTYKDLLQKVKDKDMFSFSRFGDGEWFAIFQDSEKGMNCDNHPYYPDMGQRLEKCLKHWTPFTCPSEYFIGLQSHALKWGNREQEIQEITSKYNLQWCNSNILHKANIKGQLSELFTTLSERDVLLVGPPHLYELAVREGWYLIEVPADKCWLSFEHILMDINAIINVKEWVILYCASMMSNCLIDGFHGRATQIDVGSVFDPYVGVNSRSYHKNLNI